MTYGRVIGKALVVGLSALDSDMHNSVTENDIALCLTELNTSRLTVK